MAILDKFIANAMQSAVHKAQVKGMKHNINAYKNGDITDEELYRLMRSGPNTNMLTKYKGFEDICKKYKR